MTKLNLGLTNYKMEILLGLLAGLIGMTPQEVGELEPIESVEQVIEFEGTFEVEGMEIIKDLLEDDLDDIVLDF